MTYVINAKLVSRVDNGVKTVNFEYCDTESNSLYSAASQLEAKGNMLQSLGIGIIEIVSIREGHGLSAQSADADPHKTEKELGHIILNWLRYTKEQ